MLFTQLVELFLPHFPRVKHSNINESFEGVRNEIFEITNSSFFTSGHQFLIFPKLECDKVVLKTSSYAYQGKL